MLFVYTKLPVVSHKYISAILWSITSQKFCFLFSENLLPFPWSHCNALSHWFWHLFNLTGSGQFLALTWMSSPIVLIHTALDLLKWIPHVMLLYLSICPLREVWQIVEGSLAGHADGVHHLVNRYSIVKSHQLVNRYIISENGSWNLAVLARSYQ